MSSNSSQVVITGCGWVTPFVAGDISAVLETYSRADSTVNRLHYQPVPDAVLARFTELPEEAAKEGAVRLAAAALEVAMVQAGAATLKCSSDRKGMVLGCALAGVAGMMDFANDVREQSPRFVSPIRFPQTVGNYISGALARGYDFRGPASTIACGSASSLEAMREGCALLWSDQADLVIAGGTEMLSPHIVEGLDNPQTPFADGACLFVLERKSDARTRGATVLATLVDPERTGGSRRSAADASDSVRAIASVAGLFERNAICIERWTGRTLGADGAAAFAAAMGAAMRLTVPCLGTNPDDQVRAAFFATEDNKPLHRVITVKVADDSAAIHELRATTL